MAAALLLNFRNCMIASFVLALIMIFGFGMHNPNGFDNIFWQAVVRWMHVFFGILVGTYSSIYVALPVILLWGVNRGEDIEIIKPQAARP